MMRRLAVLAALLAAVAMVQGSQANFSYTASNSGVSFATGDWVAPTVTSIRAANKGGAGTTAGKLDSGDTITFTYSEAVDPTSVLSGWNGASTAVRVRFAAGLPNDTFTVLDGSGGATVALGSVATHGDYVLLTASITSTMVLSGDGRSVVVTLGAPSNVSVLAVGAHDMAWTVGAAITDLAGNVIATPATRSESDADVDF
jgi:hypothetical protein